MRRAQDRARSARSRKIGARSASFKNSGARSATIEYYGARRSNRAPQTRSSLRANTRVNIHVLWTLASEKNELFNPVCLLTPSLSLSLITYLRTLEKVMGKWSTVWLKISQISVLVKLKIHLIIIWNTWPKNVAFFISRDECEVAHERSERAKRRVRIILFLPCSILDFFLCMHRNCHFFV